MKTLLKISKINIKLTLILSLLVILLSLESNAKPLSKDKLDSLKQLEVKITITKLNKENELLTIINKDSYTEYRKSNIFIIIPHLGGYISETNYKYFYSIIYSQFIITSCRRFAYEKTEEEILMEFEKIHLKGKVGILDNLVPIKWI